MNSGHEIWFFEGVFDVLSDKKDSISRYIEKLLEMNLAQCGSQAPSLVEDEHTAAPEEVARLSEFQVLRKRENNN